MDCEDADIEAMLRDEEEYFAHAAACAQQAEEARRPVASPARAGFQQRHDELQPSVPQAHGLVAPHVNLPVAAAVEAAAPSLPLAVAAEPPKRRRVVGKQPDERAVQPAAVVSQDTVAAFTKDEKNKLLLAVRGVWVHQKIAEGKEQVDSADSWKQLRATWQKIWSAMSPEARLEAGRLLERQGLLESFPGAVRALEYVVANEKPKGSAHPKGANRISCQAFLMTFNGPWGVIKDPDVLRQKGDILATQQAVQECQQFRTLVASALEFGKSMQAKFGATHLSMTLELCTRTLMQSGTVRVHLHVAVSKSNGRMHVWQPEAWTFMQSPPADFQHPAGRGGNYRSQMNRLHYYVQVPKTGSLWVHTNCPFQANFQVDPRWVQSMWEMNKLAFQEARLQFIATKRNVQKMLENMDAWKRHNDMVQLESQRRTALISLFGANKTWRMVPAVQVWESQWNTDLLGRRKFLVLEGPTSIGKSFFCLSRCGFEKTYHVDCAKGGEPDMREYDFFKHDAIFFDEATPELVLRQKILFMGSPFKVKMAGSSTNIFSYEICVLGKRLMIARNSWSRLLHQVDFEGAEWLRNNSVHVVQTSPLWVTNGAVGESARQA